MADIPSIADQLEAGISNAIAAHDFPATIALIKALTIVDAHRAKIVYDTIMVGLELGRRRDGAS